MKKLMQSGNLNILEALQLFTTISRRLAPKSKEAYTIDVLQFIAFLKGIGVTPVIDLPVTCFDQYLIYLEQAGYSVSTICRKFYALTSLYNFLIKRGIISQSAISAVELPKRGKTCRDVYLVEQEISNLLNSVNRFPVYQRLNVGIVIETLVFTGIRNEEATDIQLSDVDFHLRKIFIKGKGGKSRFVPICNRLFNVYRYVIQQHGGSDNQLLHSLSGRPLKRQSLERIIDKAAGLANIKKHVTPHVLRHSISTLLPRYGALRNDIKLLLGHGNVDTTDLYSHSEIEQIRRYIDCFAMTISNLPVKTAANDKMWLMSNGNSLNYAQQQNFGSNEFYEPMKPLLDERDPMLPSWIK